MPPRRDEPSVGEERTAADRDAAERFAAEAIACLDPLYAYALWLARNPSDAEDLVQETMLRGFRARASFRPGTNLRAWLFTILKRIFLNAWARSGREIPMSAATDPDPPWRPGEQARAQRGGRGPGRFPEALVDPEPALLAAVSRDAIDAAFAALPAGFREAVWLVDVEELTFAEAADVLGCPPGTVKSRVSRGRALLRASLRDHAR